MVLKCLGRAAACDWGIHWTFLLPFCGIFEDGVSPYQTLVYQTYPSDGWGGLWVFWGVSTDPIGINTMAVALHSICPLLHCRGCFGKSCDLNSGK